MITIQDKVRKLAGDRANEVFASAKARHDASQCSSMSYGEHLEICLRKFIKGNENV